MLKIIFVLQCQLRNKYLECKKGVDGSLMIVFMHQEYIFPLPRNAFPREGTGVKTDFIFRKKFHFPRL